MPKPSKHLLMVAVGLVISAAAIAYFVVKVGDRWADVWAALRQAEYVWIIPSVAALVIFYGCRAVRLRFFLSSVADVPLATATKATLIGFMANCLLPARAGEIIRPYVVHRKAGVPFGEAAGIAVGLERVFDLMGIAVLLAVTMIALAVPVDHAASRSAAHAAAPAETEAVSPLEADALQGMTVEKVRGYGLWMVAFAAVGLAGLALLAFLPEQILTLGRLALRPLPAPWRVELMEFAEALVRPMAFVRSPKRVATGMLYTVVMWSGICLSTWFLSFGFGLRLTIQSLLLIQLATTVAVAPPQAPSFIGLFQVGAMTGARVFGIPEPDAVAFANVMWLVNVVPITVVGLIVLHVEGLSLRRLARDSEEAAEDIEEVDDGQDSPPVDK